MSILVQSPFPVFTDTDGTPLDNGYIYVGEVGLNPISNPAQVYWDEELTIPAVNIRTLNGYPSYNGTPGKLFTGSDYSIVVKNTREMVVFTSLSSTEATDGTELIPGRVALGEKISDVIGDGDYVIAQTGVETNEMASGLLQITVSSATQRGTALLEYGWADGTAEEEVTILQFQHIQTHIGDELFTGAEIVFSDSSGTGMKIRLGLTEATGTGAMRIRVQKLNIGGNGIAEETPGLELVTATIANNTRTPDGSIGSFLSAEYLNNNSTIDGNEVLSGSFVLKGTELNIPVSGTPSISALSSMDIAYIDSAHDELSVYRWNDSVWVLTGSVLSISGAGNYSITTLSDTDIALIDDGNKELRVYRWGGASWSLIGSGLSISGVSFPSITSLSDTDIALIDEGNNELRIYRWGGASWSLIGSGLSISGLSRPKITSLSDTTVVFIDVTSKTLTTYRWNGISWNLVGTGLEIIGTSTYGLCTMNSTDIVFMDSAVELLQLYRWNGTIWSLVAPGLDIPGTSSSSLTAITSTEAVFFDSSANDLRTYKISSSPPSPAFN